MTELEAYAQSYLQFLKKTNLTLGARYKYNGNSYVVDDSLTFDRLICLTSVNEHGGERLDVKPSMFDDINVIKNVFGKLSRRNIGNVDVLQRYSTFMNQLDVLSHYHVGALFEQRNHCRESDYYIVLSTYENFNEPIGAAMYIDRVGRHISGIEHLKKFLYSVEQSPAIASYYLSDLPFYGELHYVCDLDKIGNTPLETYILKLQFMGIIP